MSEVVLSNVSKIYPGNVQAVDNFDLHINDGEFLVLVGPSGCGKSTTLRMIAGLEDITEGTISIGNRVVNNVHPKDRDIAMVFQNYALYPHMTVYKNMAFALKLRKVPKNDIDVAVRKTAAILGIEELLARKPKALSGGQRQRVALGRAIVREPKAFLFDEPLSNLDAKLRVETRAELKSLHLRLNTTTIYVTHDQEEAMTLGDRVVIMSEGLIQQVGTPLEVYRKPGNKFVAGFLGMPPMNFLTGKITQSENRGTFEEVNNGLKIVLPDTLLHNTRDILNQSVVLGIRPEAISVAGNPKSAQTSDNTEPESPTPQMVLRVNVVEPLGDRMDVFLEGHAGNKIVARMAASSEVTAGQTIAVDIDPTRMYIFEPTQYGKCLSHN